MIDPADPMLDERLQRRTANGRYEITDEQLVQLIRELRATGKEAEARRLMMALVTRCQPIFQLHTQGLRHRPDLREEAIANMAVHLLQEVQDPREEFITLNFARYIRCLCIDEFNRVLRQEGLIYKRDEEGRPLGRPQHVPQGLRDSLNTTVNDESNSPGADVADPQDQYEQLHAVYESQRILHYLSDSLDRKIMVLRAIKGWKWDEIAEICQKNERTVRLRYERARSFLRQCIAQEQHFSDQTVTSQ
ncbi:sigma-70-like protein [Thermosporothrix hazakensis]|jgi:DNA-directed RNA polymerase specialized sigma24 family protein|uniref:Sigma-70-like protein n=1 Tax=Thermosporothrix hazakensis TaxID=644383 RepID=A0A326U5Z4_THEHA|nr:sigma factor-like helix-turn-helix DNA-binding protein [Thermosporothrix hazakensis]PZW19337.1 sigma-70-like protein [Thermosporothrix hazakensis]GCE48225.1 hypothetical protein KTH_30940 [Thermosporothrix hazakensis]